MNTATRVWGYTRETSRGKTKKEKRGERAPPYNAPGKTHHKGEFPTDHLKLLKKREWLLITHRHTDPDMCETILTRRTGKIIRGEKMLCII